MTRWEYYQQKLNVLETGGGWFVERDGRTVALPTDPRFVDMFWYAWRIEPTVDDRGEQSRILSNDYWKWELLPQTTFRSREFGTVADAFWGGDQRQLPERLIMRGLYQPISPVRLWDHIVLWMRRLMRCRNSE